MLQFLLILAMLHPSQLLCRWLSLVADDVTGCRVVTVALCSRIYDDISNIIEPICSGYVIPFHSVEFVATAFFIFSGFKVACLTDMVLEFKVVH